MKKPVATPDPTVSTDPRAPANSSLHGVTRFINGVTPDPDTVAADLSPFSSGPVEGNVNRIKTLKRQMYGRAGFGLLPK